MGPMPVKSRNPYYQGPPSDHFDGERFRLPGHYSVKNMRDVMRWRLKSPWAQWPAELAVVEDVPPARVPGDDLRVSFVGQATLLIQCQGVNILTDPFFSRRASPVQWAGPKRVRKPGIALKNLPHIDLVLLSHNHYDHMDLPALRALDRLFNPLILTPLGNGTILKRAWRGFQLEELDLRQEHRFGSLTITLMPALHWSRRGTNDTNCALWGAFVIETRNGPVYFAGDTGYGSGQHFREARERFGPMRLAMLPIGAYEPRWFMADHHMDPQHAVKAHFDLQARCSIAMHHATVQLTGEPEDAPTRELAEARALAGLPEGEFEAPKPGGFIHLD